MGGIVAGTMLRGMFEERIKGIIDEVKERQDLILFIDEAHTIIGAGAALGTSSDAANMFKSSLASGELRIIGATTHDRVQRVHRGRRSACAAFPSGES